MKYTITLLVGIIIGYGLSIKPIQWTNETCVAEVTKNLDLDFTILDLSLICLKANNNPNIAINIIKETDIE